MIRQILTILVVLTAFCACNNNKNQNSSDNSDIREIKTSANLITNQKLFEGIELPVYTEKIKSGEAKTLKMPTGAEIKIPADAFANKEGENIKGEVTIKYKEIKSPADMIIENIDMTYDSAGQTYQFVTAGMFDLRAYSGDEELMLRRDKKIEVSYISDKKGDFAFYRNDGGWKYEGIPRENIPLNAIPGNEQKIVPLIPVLANSEKDLIIDIKTDHRKFPELAVYKNLLWKYNGKLSNSEVAEILGYPISNISLSISGVKGEYIYRFSSNNQNFEFAVRPVFTPRLMKEAMKTYESLARRENSFKTKRTVDVTSLGLMNYDAIYHRSDALVAKVEFKVKKNDHIKVEGLPLFHITGEDNVLVNISNRDQITYSKALNNKFVAVLPDKKVAVLGTSDFLKTVNALKNGQKLVLELNEIEAGIKSPSELNQIISDL